MGYNHLEIEPRWQKAWDQGNIFRAETGSKKQKYYVLDMFPYPSAQGLHVGHPEGYTATDIISRYKRAKGFNVLHPMGWDAFGLPAEQYAIQTGVHPAITTQKSIDNFRRQLKTFGFSYDWNREISTCDPKYYKWTQFIFTKLFEKGLAYQKEVPVNWCPALKTVLANEEVVDGKSERGGHPVVRMPMKQWMLKITAYAERLLNDLDGIDWPERTKEGQRYWIGKSEGARLKFFLDTDTSKWIEVFTTRPDTLFGVTFMVLAPEHPLVQSITTPAQTAEILAYVQKSSRKSDVDRQIAKEKSGVFTGAFVKHPFSGQKIPIWISDYVMMDYGTGAIMAVPGHDARDFEFATKFNLPILRVLESESELPFEGDGKLVNSDFLNGTLKTEAIQKMILEIEQRKLGTRQVQYKLRDWLFSRQRYWGEPFPILRFPNGDLKTVAADALPVLLPEVADYEPSESGESPLARSRSFTDISASHGEGVKRETDTMPGSAGSSWYFLRYVDPENDSEPFSFDAQKYWMPVDLYLGGPEHTVGHLLYARFWHKVMFDAGLVSTPEPFQKLFHQGMILGEDGEKMSKSRGNVINPDDVIRSYGADSLRAYLMFMGPLDKDKPWSTTGIEGIRRFLDRVWRLAVDEESDKVIAIDTAPSAELNKMLHKTIQKVTSDMETMGFNTAISQMMILVNEMYKLGEKPKSVLLTLSQLLMPFTPHIAEELWRRLGGVGLVSQCTWPSFDAALVVDDTVSIGVQVNGKLRGAIELKKTASEEEAMRMARTIPAVQQAIGSNPIKKIIYKPALILNIIA